MTKSYFCLKKKIFLGQNFNLFFPLKCTKVGQILEYLSQAVPKVQKIKFSEFIWFFQKWSQQLDVQWYVDGACVGHHQSHLVATAEAHTYLPIVEPVGCLSWNTSNTYVELKSQSCTLMLSLRGQLEAELPGYHTFNQCPKKLT